jgi:hypothetical protein
MRKTAWVSLLDSFPTTQLHSRDEGLPLPRLAGPHLKVHSPDHLMSH